MRISQLEQALEEKAQKGEIKYTPARKNYFSNEIYKLLDDIVKKFNNRYCSANPAYLEWFQLMINLKILNKNTRPDFQNLNSQTNPIEEYSATGSGVELYLELRDKFSAKSAQ
ncbi:MAG: hypothetical protein Q8L27_01785 [archaeon]|nr:hypothetical protein [archaeon]